MAQATTPRGGEQTSWGKRTLTVSFRPAFVISGFIVLLICWTGIFILGVMAGRSSAEKQTALPPVASRQGEAASDAQESGTAAAIINPTDLRYQRTLKRKGLTDPAPDKAAPFKPAVAPAQAAAPKAEGGAAPQAADRQRLLQGTSAPENQRYDYVYQLATFQASEERKIDSLRESLEGEGFRTRVKRTGSKRAVQLVVRGTSSVEEDVARVARRLNLGEPWLRQKTPLQ